MFHHDTHSKDKHALDVPRQANNNHSRSPSPQPPSRANSSSPPPTPGVVTPHPRDSDSDHSQPPSRAASMRRGQSDMSDLHAQPPLDGRSGGLQRRLSQRSASHGSTNAKTDTLKPAVLVAGQPVAVVKKEEVVGAGGNKFTLKDLIGLGDGPGKLSRKPSAAGSAKGSDRGSTKGSEREYGDNNSTASLLKKYGICDKAAIGKGATAVVRLAHKWDRREEKLYAVKVSSYVRIVLRFLGIPETSQERDRKGLCQETDIGVLHLVDPSPYQRGRDRRPRSGRSASLVRGHGVLPRWRPLRGDQERWHVEWGGRM